MELSGEPKAFSALIGAPVRDQGGRRLGRVFEVRAHWERDGVIVLDELMIGRRALWQRLRGPADTARGIPWENVAEIGAEGITVRHPG
jgi:sporulation protein YlmC with PRC-barrel domain